MFEYLEKMKQIQEFLLEYSDEEDNEQIKYQKIIQILASSNIRKDKNDLKSFLIMMSNIIENRYQSNKFCQKIFDIISYIKNDIINFFSNIEKYNIFKRNPKIIVYFIEEKMIINDKLISKKLFDSKYRYYYYPEIKELFEKEEQEYMKKPSECLPKNFLEKRENNELDDYI